MSADLLHLSQRNHLAGQYAEGDRVLALRAAVEASIDADLRDNSSELVCGRGRRRLDNLQVNKFDFLFLCVTLLLLLCDVPLNPRLQRTHFPISFYSLNYCF